MAIAPRDHDFHGDGAGYGHFCGSAADQLIGWLLSLVLNVGR